METGYVHALDSCMEPAEPGDVFAVFNLGDLFYQYDYEKTRLHEERKIV